jgi:hypothetical protein
LLNVGVIDQTFRIDEFGIEIQVPAGHSVSFKLDLPAGAHVADSYIKSGKEGTEGLEIRRLETIIRILPEGVKPSRG